MKIGVAGPVEIKSLSKYLDNLTADDLNLGLGGTAVNVIVEGFIKGGHQVVVFTLDLKIKSKKILEGENLKIVIGHFRGTGKQKTFDFCRKEYLQIRDMILESDVEVVNAHWSYEFAIGTILSGKKHLITFRDHATTVLKIHKRPYRLTRWLMDKWVKSKGVNFNFNSPYLKNKFGKWGLHYPYIPNPIKEEYISSSLRHYDRNQPFKICCVFNGWEKRKNPELAIKAFQQLLTRKYNAQLHFFGKDCEPKGIGNQWCINNNLCEKVFFHGFMSHVELLKEIKGMHLMLHTAIEESFGNNLIEAQALGLPVIAGSSSGAVPWVLDFGKAGLLVDITCEDEISQAIVRLIESKDLYQQISIAGLQNVQTRFSQSIVTESYMNLLTKVSK